MEGVFNRFNIPIGKSITKGEAKLSAYEFLCRNNPLYNLRAIRDGERIMLMSDGSYVQLSVHNELVMSDTDMEKRSNAEFCKVCNGRVLIAGLGLGLVLHNILPKLHSGQVTEVVIIEKSQDVIDLVSPYFKDVKEGIVKMICANIFNWWPQKGEKFDTIYFDIWSDINTDNLDEIRILHNRFKWYLNQNNPNKWMDSWMKKLLQRRKKRGIYW